MAEGGIKLIVWSIMALIGLALLGVAFFFPFLIIFFLGYLGFVFLLSFRYLYEYQRGVIFTLGKYSGVMNAGIFFITPFVDDLRVVDMRINTVDIPKQEIITKDNITILANAVVFFKVTNPADVVIKIQDYQYAVAQYTQTALRDVVGNNDLDTILQERDKIAGAIETMVDKETDPWGVDISSIKIQEIELPAEMKRAMAKQAEAERTRRATVTISLGELEASQNLQKAAQTLSKGAGALHLRTLQTISEIAQDPSEKIMMVVPIELLKAFERFGSKK
ncbi:MAG: slipin family protein [archaeon]|nr:slipin family protein [archaeon]